MTTPAEQQFLDAAKAKEDADFTAAARAAIQPAPAAAPTPAPAQTPDQMATTPAPTTLTNVYRPIGPGQEFLQAHGVRTLSPSGTILDYHGEVIGRIGKAIEAAKETFKANLWNSAKTVAAGVEKILTFAPYSGPTEPGQQAFTEYDRKMQGAQNVVLGLLGMGISTYTFAGGAAGQAFADQFPDQADTEILDPRIGGFVRMMMGENPGAPGSDERNQLERPFTLRNLVELAATVSAPIVAELGGAAVKAKIASDRPTVTPRPPQPQPQPQSTAGSPPPFTTIPSELNQKTWYHGTGTNDLTAASLDPTVTKAEGLFGQGVYLTDNPKIAEGYAKARSRRTGSPNVYQAKINITNVLNVEDPINPRVSRAFLETAQDLDRAFHGDIADSVKAAITAPGATTETVWRRLSQSVSELSHQDAIPVGEFSESFGQLAGALKAAGYDALTYHGGKRTGNQPHQALVLLDPNDLYSQTGRSAQVTSLIPQGTGSSGAKPTPSQKTTTEVAPSPSTLMDQPGPLDTKGTSIQPLTPEAVQAFIDQAKQPGAIPPAAIEGPRVFGMNLERLGLDEAAKKVMTEVNRNLVEQGITAPERLKQTHATTVAKAIEKPMTVERALGLPMDQPLSASENLALRALNKALIQRITDQAKIVAEYPEELGTKTEMAATLALAREIGAKTKGVQISIAQALEAQKLVPSATPGFMELLERTARTSDMDAVAKAFTSLPEAQRAGFWENLVNASEAGRTTVLRLYQSSLLSNPRTHIKIIESQALRTLWNVGERAVARVNHLLFFRDDPNGVANGEATAMVRGMGEGTIDGFRLAGKAWQTGSAGRLDLRDVITGAEADATVESLGASPRGWSLYDVATSPGRAIGAIDAFYKGVNYRMAVKAEAVRIASQEGLRGNAYDARVAYVESHVSEFPSIGHRAEVLAQESAFQGPAGPIQQRFEDLINTVPGASAIIPFKRAPGQLLKFGMQITPVVNFPSLMGGELYQQIKAGGAPRELAMARVEMGAAIAVGAGYLYLTGRLTGKGPTDASSREAWREQGFQPYSVKVGNNWYPYRWAEGITSPLGLTADFLEIYDQIPADHAAELAVAVPMAFTRNMLDPTYFMTVRDFMDAVTAPDKKAERFAESLGRSTVPALIRGINEARDPEFKEVRSYLDAVMSGLPGNLLMPWRSEITGEPMVRPPGVPVRMLSPITQSEEKPDPVLQEIIDERVRVLQTPDVISGRKESLFQMQDQLAADEAVTLTPEQKDRLVVLKTQIMRDPSGRTLHAALEREINSRLYQSLPPWPQGDGRAIRLMKIQHDFAELARLELLRENKDIQNTLDARKYEKLKGRVPVGTAPAPSSRIAPFLQSLGR